MHWNCNIHFSSSNKPIVSRLIEKNVPTGTISETTSILSAVADSYPKDKRSLFFMTPGGFAHFKWPQELAHIQFARQADDSVRDILRNHAQAYIEQMLPPALKNKLSQISHFMTVGIDSYAAETPENLNSGDGPHVELIAMLDLTKKHLKLHWTGKFYPTPKQATRLIRNKDLDSHFLKICGFRVLLLGCHDLNVFSPRSISNAEGERLTIIKDFRNRCHQFQPELILHHPHSTDSFRIWLLPFTNIQRLFGEHIQYASSGAYHRWNYWKIRSPLDKVLNYTKKGNVLDIVMS